MCPVIHGSMQDTTGDHVPGNDYNDMLQEATMVHVTAAGMAACWQLHVMNLTDNMKKYTNKVIICIQSGLEEK